MRFSLFGLGAKTVEGEIDASVHGMVQHAGAYGLLTILLLSAFATSQRIRRALVMFAVIHGLVTEGIQAFVPQRTAGIDDFVANVAGVCIGWLLFVLLISKQRVVSTVSIAVLLAVTCPLFTAECFAQSHRNLHAPGLGSVNILGGVPGDLFD